MITIEFPFPPVGWKAPHPDYARRRMYPNEAYKAWKDAAVMIAGAQYHGEPLEGKIGINVQVRVRDGRHGDLTNYTKAVEDALQAVRDGAGVFRDDKQVAWQNNSRVVDKANPGITVRVISLDNIKSVLFEYGVFVGYVLTDNSTTNEILLLDGTVEMWCLASMRYLQILLSEIMRC